MVVSNSNKIAIATTTEFQASGIATQKSDVFAFGVVMLELLSGEELLKYRYNKHTGDSERISVIDIAKAAIIDAAEFCDVEGRLRRWMDRRLRDSFPVAVVEKLAWLALECVQDDPVNRPEMRTVAGKISQLYLESNEWSTNMKRFTPMEKLLGGQPKNGPSKTKIVCTLGPASRSVEMIEKLLKAGMNVARFNFSHDSHEYHQETLNNLRTAMNNTGILCAVMLDTKGPEIRTGILKGGKPIELIQGQEITISIDDTIKGDSNIISMSYKKLAEDLKPGDVIFCSDGTISLTVLSCDKFLGLVRCRCENSAVLGERKNVNLPGVVVDLPTLTEKDKEDILQWGVPNKINIIALSYVRKGSDLDEVRELLGVHAKSIMLMSKVENQEGVANVDEIMEKTDAFMVAGGTLEMEIPTWKKSKAQKRMIEKANALGKPIVIATQMLDSITDITNAVLDGTDCVMLCGETAAGAHPETAVLTMSMICKDAELNMDYEAAQEKIKEAIPLPLLPIESSAASAVSKARSVNAKAIVVLTMGGYTAELVAKYRPSVPILSVVPEWASHSASRGLIYRGIIPVIARGAYGSAKEAIRFSFEFGKLEIFKAGDSVVVLQMMDGSFVVNVD